MTPLKIVVGISLIALVVGGFLRLNVQEALAQSGTINQLTQWLVSGGNIKLASTTASIRVPVLSNCDTIDTSATGVFTCGTDASGSGGSDAYWSVIDGKLVPTTTREVAASFFTATSTSATSTLPNLSTSHFALGSDFLTDITGTGLSVVNGVLTGNTGTVTSVALTAPTGLTVTGSPVTTTGTLALTYTSGYEGLLTASSTNWNSFYNTPSTRITDGTGLTWSTNTLNCDTATSGAPGCLASADWSAFNNKISSTSIDTSAELATFVTDKTGTAGSLVFSRSPTFTGTTLFASAVGSASSSISALTVTMGTTTNATSTNFFANNATLAAVFGVVDMGAATSLEIPNNAAPTVDAAGEIAVDTTSGQFRWFDGVRTHVITGTSSPAFSVASTTQDASGKSFAAATTTFYLKNAPEAQILTGWYCKASSTGSVIVRFGDGTNWTNQGTCSTTGTLITATTNNTFTAFEDFVVQIGTAATNPSRVTITTVINKTAD